MAALLNPTARRLALAAGRRLSPAAAAPAELLASHGTIQVRSKANLVDATSGFDEMVSGMQKYYMLGGKGGVGKTSIAASLAVKFANRGQPTLIASMDPAHSLSDSFEQDVSGGAIVPVNGVDSLFALEIDHKKAKEEFRADAQRSRTCDLLGSMGLGMLADKLGDFKLHDMLKSAGPPGFDEAIALSMLMELEHQEYKFRRIVLDTAATGHTLGFLSSIEYVDTFIGTLMKVKKIASYISALKSDSGEEQSQSAKLEDKRQQIVRVRELLHNPELTEFITVTIPTVMAVSESSRLHAFLKKEGVPTRRLIVNQVLPPSSSDCKFCAVKRKEELHALDMVRNDSGLRGLKLIQAPLLDVEVRGVPALRFLGDMVWKEPPRM